MGSARKSSKRPPVKSADTSVSVNESIEAIKDLVRKYGATGFGVIEDYEKRQSVLQLMLPDLPGEAARVPLRIPVNVGRVHAALYEQPRAAGGDRFKDDPDVKAKRREQAERVAWRHAFYTIEVALLTAQLGGRPISESLMADVMVAHDDGRSERMGDYMLRTQGAIGPGVRALLPPPSSTPTEAGEA